MAKKLWFLALFFLLIPASLFAFQPLFDTWISYDVGFRPTWVTTADMDGDLDLDLIIANEVGNSVSILKNNGDGSFAERMDISGRERPSFVAVADLDGDTDLDLITSNNGNCCHGIAPQYITIFKNNGDGTFGSGVDYPTGYSSLSIVATDLDGDSDVDLAVANTGWPVGYPSYYPDSTISILENNGDGTFASKIDYVAGYLPYSIASSDFDGDGDPDLAVSHSDSVLSIFWNDGSGALPGRNDFNLGPWARHLSISDFDGDGDSDLAISRYGNYFSVLKNDGVGTSFERADYTITGYYALNVFASDLDSDGDNDLIAGDQQIGGNFYVFKNQGNGTFTTGIAYETADGVEAVASADLDSDGDNDIATVSWWSGSVAVVANNGDGTFPPVPESFQAGVNPQSVFASDLDGDGDDDLAVANSGNCGDFYGCIDYSVSVLKNDGGGRFLEEGRYPTNYYSLSVFVSDLDGDGDKDLAVANAGSLHGFANTVSVLKNNGNGTFADDIEYNTSNGPVDVCASDLDGDGDQDLAVVNAGVGRFDLGNTVSIFENRGDGTFMNRVDYPTGYGPYSVAALDLDGDGDNDLAVANRGTYWLYGEAPDSTVSIFLNNGDGTFATKVDYATKAAPRSVFLSDVDRDTDNDLVTSNGSVLLNNGDGTFGNRMDYALNGNSVFVADVDGDGDNDIIAPNSSADVVSILFNNGDGSFANKIDYGIGNSPVSVFPFDVDKDGDLDLTIAESYSDKIVVLRNRINSQNCVATKGDLNDDGIITVFDVVLILNCTFLGEGGCSACFADVNCSGSLTPVDVVLELFAVYLNQPFPCT